MLLSNLSAGAAFTVTRVTLEREVGRRLADMGFVEGANGCVIRKKLLGGPIEVHIMGYEVLLRRNEAAGIDVELDGTSSAAVGGEA